MNRNKRQLFLRSRIAVLRTLVACLGVASILLVGVPHSAHAQDVITTSVNKNGVSCWDFSVKNNNSSHLPITRIGLKILTAGVTFSDNSWPNNWNGDVPTNDSASYVTAGSAITYPQTLGGFSFCIVDTNYDSPVQIQWTTISGTTTASTGTMVVLPTTFQSLATIDSASATTSLNGPDPCFNFTVYNNNSGSFAIKSVSFQLQNIVAGVVRPSAIVAPAGWSLDSAGPTIVSFHELGSSNDLESGKSLSGFKICLRANPNNSIYNWVWRAYGDGVLLDRDTIRNLSITPGQTSFASNDTVRAQVQNGCLYDFTLSNFHSTNPAPPSRITKFVLTSTTSGVTFVSAPSFPLNWGKAINGPANALTFASQSLSEGLASGAVESNFAANIHNPTGGPFTLHWQAFNNATETSNGDLNLTCTEAVASPDVATLATSTAGGDCCFTLNVQNAHNPPSNVIAISLSMPADKGSFTGSPASTLNWTPTTGGDNHSIRFTAPTGESMSTTESQVLNFCVNPAVSGQSVPVTWTTYDAQNAVISTGVVNPTCSIITKTCDKDTILSPIDANNCLYGIEVINRRGQGAAVNSIELTPLDGWQIDSIKGAGWSGSTSDQGHLATLTSPTGISDGTFQAFVVGFIGYNTQSNFHVVVKTTDVNSNVCLDTLAFTCTPTPLTGAVDVNGSYGLSVTVSPNPVSTIADVELNIPTHEYVSMTLIDVMGRPHETIINQMLEEGTHNVKLHGGNLPSGTYYLRVETATGRITKKVVINR